MSVQGETVEAPKARKSAQAITADRLEAEKLNGRTAELHELLHALQAVRTGDFSVRMAGHETGLFGKIADTFNEIIANNQSMAQQLEHVGQLVGREIELQNQASSEQVPLHPAGRHAAESVLRRRELTRGAGPVGVTGCRAFPHRRRDPGS